MDSKSKTDTSESRLEIRSIADISDSPDGNPMRFRIPEYQRGYRWERSHVLQLLEDLAEHIRKFEPGDPYYLQPVVVAPFKTADGDNTREPGSNLDDCDFDWDLIDGQQRLTTILIILKALEEFKVTHPDRTPLRRLDFSVPYSISYATRPRSRFFLENIDQDTIPWEGKEMETKEVARSFPDFLYMWHAFQEARSWIIEHEDKLADLGAALLEDVKVIWYQLNEEVENYEKFTQLNVGKIPLTNSELVKALLLSDINNSRKSSRGGRSSDLQEYERGIIINQWDTVEKELRDPKFWGFLTTDAPSEPRIDFIFDLFSGKPRNNNDDFYTFQHYVDMLKADPRLSGKDIWDDIYSKYLRLKDWYNDSWYYHRIGYLVAVDPSGTALGDIFRFAYPEKKEGPEEEGTYEESKSKPGPKTKSEVKEKITELIKKSINWEKEGLPSIWALSYDDPESQESKDKPAYPHNPKIKTLLTLYNVMIYDDLNATYGVRYPFYSHHTVSGDWSLEHIHAQHSERLTKAEQWTEWVGDHLESLRRIRKVLDIDRQADEKTKALWDALDRKMSDFTEAPKPNGDVFDEIVREFSVLTASSDKRTSGEYKDELTNMALLSRDGNSRLNNSTFDVKRVIVSRHISRDFLPIGTERVFLKSIADSYTRSSGEPVTYKCDIDHTYYWGAGDREAYRHDLWRHLRPFLPANQEPSLPATEES